MLKLEKFTYKMQEIISKAVELAQHRQHQAVEPEHLLVQEKISL